MRLATTRRPLARPPARPRRAPPAPHAVPPPSLAPPSPSQADDAGLTPTGAEPPHWADFTASLTDGRARELRAAVGTVAAVAAHEPRLRTLDDAAFPAETAALRAARSSGASLDSLLPLAFALVREAGRRVLGLRAFDVQVVGATVLHAGRVAEMGTGEGKTLVAALPAYLNALDGRGVHIVTVNDYLARRDREWVGRALEFLGLSVSVVTEATPHPARSAAFAADVTYVTAQQLAFTYLRDNAAARAATDIALTWRPLHYAIVDEADSLLIDDCRTPLILSGPPLPTDAAKFRLAQHVFETAGWDGGEMEEAPVDPDTSAAVPGAWGDYTLDRRRHRVSLTPQGAIHAVAALVKAGAAFPSADAEKRPPTPADLWASTPTAPDPWGPYLVNAVKANTLFKRDVHYIVRGNAAKIVDGATGRVLPLSRWTDNLHQAVEAKERLPVRGASLTQGSITYQTFFRMYGKLAGMTGTAARDAEELFDVYNLDVSPIPPHRPRCRIDHPPRVFFEPLGKQCHLALLLAAAAAGRRPVLIGTRSVEESEEMSALLSSGLAEATACLSIDYPDLFPPGVRPTPIPHALLNAKPDRAAAEAATVAQAGLPGAVTVATSMAGRGTDVLLGGNARGLAAAALVARVAGVMAGGQDVGPGGARPQFPNPDTYAPPPPSVTGALERAAASLRALGGPLPPPEGGYEALGLVTAPADDDSDASDPLFSPGPPPPPHAVRDRGRRDRGRVEGG